MRIFMGKHGKILLTVMVLASVGSGCRISANFHEVDPGKLYRSAQLTGPEFERAIGELGIRTIINLRGENPGSDWYDEEVAAAEKHGVSLISIGMSAKRLPHREDLIKLLDAFRDAERPMLVHCKAGADRTGEATAIYLMEYMGKSKKAAIKALSPYYLHLPTFTPAKRYFMRQYEGLDWAYQVYDPCVQSYKHYDQAKYCGGEALEIEPDDDEPDFEAASPADWAVFSQHIDLTP